MKKLLPFVFLFSLGCGGFKQSSEPFFGGSETGNSVNLDYKLIVNGGPLDGRLVVDQIQNSVLKLLVPIGVVNQAPVTDSFVFQQYNLSGRVSADSLGFKNVEIFIPLSLISQGVSSGFVSTLANGDTFNFFGVSQLQHLSFPLDANSNVQIHLYLSPPQFVGVFIQTPFDFGSFNEREVVPVDSLMHVGYASTRPHRPPLNGGRFVFISLPQ